MRYLLSLIIALATLLPSLAQAYDVLVLQSRRDPAYEEVLKGFRAGHRFSERVVVISDYAEVDIPRMVREERPALVLALGDSALTAAKRVRQIPVISLMSLGVHGQRDTHSNLACIGMYAPPERYLALFQDLKARRVGVIHNPGKSGWYLRQARQAAARMGIELIVREVNAPRDTLTRLNELKNRVDALWMLPDTVAVTRETAEAYFRFSQEERIPVVSFAGPYLGLGAAAVLEIDRAELGRQAGDMAAELLREGESVCQPAAWPRATALRTNPSVLRNLGIAFEYLGASRE